MPCTIAHTLKGNHLTRITYIPKPPCTRLLCEKWALYTLSYKKNAYLCKDIGSGTRFCPAGGLPRRCMRHDTYLYI